MKMTSRNVAVLMKPRPPICIRAAMITWPDVFQKVAVSTVTNPVTVTAEVAVKRASRNGVNLPVVLKKGSQSRKVPTAIRLPKL